MPSIKIFSARQKTAGQKRQLVAAVARAFTEQMGKQSNCAVALFETDCVSFPEGLDPLDYLIVEIDIFPGRTLDQKRALYRAVADGIRAAGQSTAGLKIVLHEPPLENWGMASGQVASEFLAKKGRGV